MTKRYRLSDEQIEWIKTNYSNIGPTKIAETVGVSRGATNRIAKKLGLKISRERLIALQKEKGKNYADKHRKYTFDKQWFIENYPKLGGRECSRILNIPQKMVQTFASKMKIKSGKEGRGKSRAGDIPANKKYLLIDNDKRWFIENYPSLGAIKCSEKLNIPARALSTLASKMNLKVDKNRKKDLAREYSNRATTFFAQKREDTEKKSNLIIISQPEEAYTLGFMWGDGYLNHPVKTQCCYPYIGIEKNDFDSLLKTFCSIGKWRVYYRKRINRKEQGECLLCDNKWGFFLRNNDYENKSTVSPSKILIHIPDHLKMFWWRGYVDADGCFYLGKTRTRQFSLAGSFEQDWSEFEKLLCSLGISKYSIKRRVQNKKSKSSIVGIFNQLDIEKLGNYLYGNEPLKIGLKRKYDKFNLIKELGLKKRGPIPKYSCYK